MYVHSHGMSWIFERNTTVVTIPSFLQEIGRQSHPKRGNRLRFSSLGPELTSRRGAIWVGFYENSTVSESRIPYLSGFSGRGARIKRPTAVYAPLTALRLRGNCPSIVSGICKDFFLVSPVPLCRWASVASAVVATMWTRIGKHPYAVVARTSWWQARIK
jgi:hypothetical protein